MNYPECSDDESILLNNFGQPVCHCANDTYPLEDPFTYKNITSQRKCYQIGEGGPCPMDEGLEMAENTSPGLLRCGHNIAPLSILPKGNRCRSGQIFAFGSCRPAGRSG